MSIEQYKSDIDRIKRSSEYIKLATRHRGDLDQKNFDKFRLRITQLENRIKELQPKAGVPRRIVPRDAPARHPVNPAIARIATEPLPGAKRNENIIINKSKLATSRVEHTKIIESKELDDFIYGPSDNADDNLFDDMLFDEPLPEDL